jgi:hypothetical protein
MYMFMNNILKGFYLKKWSFLCRMFIEWREREHEEVNAAVGRDARAQQDLKQCGLYKFWAHSSLLLIISNKKHDTSTVILPPHWPHEVPWL